MFLQKAAKTTQKNSTKNFTGIGSMSETRDCIVISLLPAESMTRQKKGKKIDLGLR